MTGGNERERDTGGQPGARGLDLQTQAAEGPTACPGYAL